MAPKKKTTKTTTKKKTAARAIKQQKIQHVQQAQEPKPQSSVINMDDFIMDRNRVNQPVLNHVKFNKNTFDPNEYSSVPSTDKGKIIQRRESEHPIVRCAICSREYRSYPESKDCPFCLNKKINKLTMR
jgi:hypothetical protein